ncbi:hypothetical protein CK203_026665 [Vitis vinifera]|uniref:Uncharacterized protein n=1 Tax=Vitis vinifera TaxID=29760 RepID=A0A438ITZ4_VITVI|nr:hypothetical protein CK203_026665 [Vitis vinifera]
MNVSSRGAIATHRPYETCNVCWHCCVHLQHCQLLTTHVPLSHFDPSRKDTAVARKSLKQLQKSQPHTSHALSRKRITGGINGGLINDATLKSLDFRRDFLFPFSLLLHNTGPVGRQESLQLLISIVLLADLSVTLLTLLQFYWISLGAFLAVLLILPLSLLSPFPAGLNALFSQGPRRSSLARIYALWNATSLSNIAVAFICGICHYGLSFFQPSEKANTWHSRREMSVVLRSVSFNEGDP